MNYLQLKKIFTYESEFADAEGASGPGVLHDDLDGLADFRAREDDVVLATAAGHPGRGVVEIFAVS